MLYYDLAFLFIPIVFYAAFRTENSKCVLLPTLFTFYYAYMSNLFDIHSGVINHVIYGISFVSTAYFASRKLYSVILIYSVFQLFYSLDYFLRPLQEVTIFSSVYFYAYILLNFMLILAMFERSYNDSSRNNRDAVFNTFGMVDLWHNQTYTKKSEKA